MTGSYRIYSPLLGITAAWLMMTAGVGAALGDQDRLFREAREHWAFQPLPEHFEIPDHTNAIDHLVRSKLPARQLTPAPQATPRVLIRRLYFDLIGLPPAHEEVERWSADWSPDTFRRLIDHLLASPHYGERWGRHWLDVARYADTMGHMGGGKETRYPFAYTYRDWVIQAFNKDLPFDQFTKLQIAADLMLPKGKAREHDLAALGFLTVGSRFSGKDDIVIDDRIDVVTRGFLGLTVSCARCHDHMFDPVPIADYYSLYGVFVNSPEPDDLPLIPGAERDPKAAAEFDREFAKRQGAVDQFLRDNHDELRTAGKIGEYLKLVIETEGMKTSDIVSLAGKRNLFRRVGERWRLGLRAARKANLPVFIPWHAAAEAFGKGQTNEAVAALNKALANPKTNPLIAAALRKEKPKNLHDLSYAYGRALAAADADQPHPDKAREELRQILRHPAGPTGFPLEQVAGYLNRGASTKYRSLVAKVDQLIVESPGAPARAMVVQDVTKPRPAHIFKRGDPRSRGDRVPRQFLAILEGSDRRPFPEDTSGRLELAERIASPDNPLTARVIANRVWQHHFGAPLVRTPSDFGLQTPEPVQRDLLDWLAASLTRNGWSLKHLHRVILDSHTWRQSSVGTPANGNRDAANEFLTHAERIRLGYETTRDALLAVTGELDRSAGGRPEPLEGRNATKRRAIYGFIDRYNVAAELRTFDFADPNLHAPERPETTVPQQALFFMNSPFVEARARQLAATANGSPEERVRTLYRRIYARDPEPAEISAAVAFATGDAATGWQNLAQALLAANEFSFVD